MKAYLFAYDVWCEDCLPAERHPDNRPDDFDDRADPHEFAEEDEGEVDAPLNCCECRRHLTDGVGLTNAGVRYVVDAALELLEEGPDAWNAKIDPAPEFLTANVAGMLTAAADDYTVCPILADALQDAGYDDTRDLSGLRRPNVYTLSRRCEVVRDWAKDLARNYSFGVDGLNLNQFFTAFLEVTEDGRDPVNVARAFARAGDDTAEWGRLAGEWTAAAK